MARFQTPRAGIPGAEAPGLARLSYFMIIAFRTVLPSASVSTFTK
jgi:hypothetical protein